jgi:hypothetical protein
LGNLFCQTTKLIRRNLKGFHDEGLYFKAVQARASSPVLTGYRASLDWTAGAAVST